MTVCFCAYRSTFAQYWTHNFPVGIRKSRLALSLWNFIEEQPKTTSQPTELWFGMSIGNTTERKEWGSKHARIHIYTHTHTMTVEAATARASTSKMILKSTVWSLYKNKKKEKTNQNIYIRNFSMSALTISSHTLLLLRINTEWGEEGRRRTDMDDRGKFVNCVWERACNKVNCMEHVFANVLYTVAAAVACAGAAHFQSSAAPLCLSFCLCWLNNTNTYNLSLYCTRLNSPTFSTVRALFVKM